MTLPKVSGSGVTVIVGELRGAIEDGSYGHNQRLPAERDLAAHYGASRSTVREALRLLEDEGLVVRKVGSGTFVHNPSASANRRYRRHDQPARADGSEGGESSRISPGSRWCMRPPTIWSCLRNPLVDLEACAAMQSAFSSADERFHLALAEATGNPLMAWIYRQINDVRCHDQWNEMKRKVLSEEAIAIYNRQHRALLQAIRKPRRGNGCCRRQRASGPGATGSGRRRAQHRYLNDREPTDAGFDLHQSLGNLAIDAC